METINNANSLVSGAFNGFLLSHVLVALNESGLFRDWATADEVLPPSDDRREVFMAAMAVLGDAGLVSCCGDRYRLTELGKQVIAQRGFFVWAIGGYGNFFTALGSILSGNSQSLQRNEALVAKGSGLIDRALLRDQVAQYVLGLGASCIADLGCGDGTRLCHLATQDRLLMGVGVDCSPASVALARAQIEQHGLVDRLSVVQGDCLELLQHSLSERVDCVISFFLLHDLLFAKSGKFGAIADALLANFPNASKFIFADTARTDHFQLDTYPPPVFIRGFELVHAMMGTPTRTIEEYRQALRCEQMMLVEVLNLPIPNSYLFVLNRS